jgi:hypothetical protein
MASSSTKRKKVMGPYCNLIMVVTVETLTKDNLAKTI